MLSNIFNSIFSLLKPIRVETRGCMYRSAISKRHFNQKPNTELDLDGVDITEQRRALSELKSARTLISKALMRISAPANKLGKAGYDLTEMINELSSKINKK